MLKYSLKDNARYLTLYLSEDYLIFCNFYNYKMRSCSFLKNRICREEDKVILIYFKDVHLLI